MPACGLAPGDDPVRVDTQLVGTRAQPAQRGGHVLQLGGEDGLAGQPVVDRRHREPGADQALERVGTPVAPGRAEDAAGAQPPAAAVQEQDDRGRSSWRGVEVEQQRPEPGRRGVLDRPPQLSDPAGKVDGGGQWVGVGGRAAGRSRLPRPPSSRATGSRA